MHTISRDSFARTELVRKAIHASLGSTQTCDFCGQEGVQRNDHHTLYEYGYEEDSASGSRIHMMKGEFCCIGCFRAYHNL